MFEMKEPGPVVVDSECAKSVKPKVFRRQCSTLLMKLACGVGNMSFCCSGTGELSVNVGEPHSHPLVLRCLPLKIKMDH
jgi:hypothetical protein